VGLRSHWPTNVLEVAEEVFGDRLDDDARFYVEQLFA
jgi:hypothetical protein